MANNVENNATRLRETDLVESAASRTASVPEVLRVNNLSYGYRPDNLTIKNFSMSLGEGEISSIIGPSGCGKTTLLSLIAGMASPNSGTVEWGPDPDNGARHSLTMMFQKDTLLPWLTTAHNAGLYYQVSDSKVERSEQLERVATLLKLVGLEGSEERYPYELSGGMRRRVAFVSAIVAHPRVLLLDEPFSALDEPTRVALHQDVREIVKREGISVVLVTHDLAEAVTLSDQVVLMATKPGRVAEQYRVDLGESRDMRTVREDPRFLDLYSRLWRDLNRQVELGKAA